MQKSRAPRWSTRRQSRFFDSREGPYTFTPPPGGGGAYKFPGFGSRLGEGKGEGKPRCSNTPQDPWRGRRIIIINNNNIYIYNTWDRFVTLWTDPQHFGTAP